MRLAFINNGGPTGADVIAHRDGCADIARELRHPFSDHAGTGDYETKTEAWADYNADFIEDDGPEAAWDIDFKPCCKLPA